MGNKNWCIPLTSFSLNEKYKPALKFTLWLHSERQGELALYLHTIFLCMTTITRFFAGSFDSQKHSVDNSAFEDALVIPAPPITSLISLTSFCVGTTPFVRLSSLRNGANRDFLGDFGDLLGDLLPLIPKRLLLLLFEPPSTAGSDNRFGDDDDDDAKAAGALARAANGCRVANCKDVCGRTS